MSTNNPNEGLPKSIDDTGVLSNALPGKLPEPPVVVASEHLFEPDLKPSDLKVAQKAEEDFPDNPIPNQFTDDGKLLGPEKVKVKDGVLVFDRKTRAEATQCFKDLFKSAIEKGDINMVETYLWYLLDEPENYAEVIQKVREATEKQDASGLEFLDLSEETIENKFHAVQVVLPFRTMGERQIIRNALVAQWNSLPIRNTDGSNMDFNSVDCALVQTDEESFTLYVASKKGIKGASVVAPENLKNNTFKPEYDQIGPEVPPTGTQTPKTIVIPILPAENGEEPLMKNIKVVIPHMDLPAYLNRAEEEMRKEAQRRKEQEEYAAQAANIPTSRNTSSSSYTTGRGTH